MGLPNRGEGTQNRYTPPGEHSGERPWATEAWNIFQHIK